MSDLIKDVEKITRIEVIGPDGREYVRYLKEDEHPYYMLQDDGHTLKMVIEKTNEVS